MKKLKIVIALGTRPEVIRFSPLLKELEMYDDIKVLLLHTGQHYSDDMNDVFFRELGIKPPDYNLSIGSVEPAEQLYEIIRKSSDVFKTEKPDMVCVWGDTNSSVGVALASNKMNIKLCHLEAGCRSHDNRMAEEFNRRIIDHISDVLFPLSFHDTLNLKKEAVLGKVHSVGDPLYDVFLQRLAGLEEKGLRGKYGLGDKYVILTLHRAENVDNKETISSIIKEILKIKGFKVIFPIHPRTLKRLSEFRITNLSINTNIVTTGPLSYHEILELLKFSSAVITDSGGFQKEAFYSKVPCAVLRKTTEWLDPVKYGVSFVLDPQKKKALSGIHPFLANNEKLKRKFKEIKGYPYGKGNSSHKIVALIRKEILSLP